MTVIRFVQQFQRRCELVCHQLRIAVEKESNFTAHLLSCLFETKIFRICSCRWIAQLPSISSICVTEYSGCFPFRGRIYTGFRLSFSIPPVLIIEDKTLSDASFSFYPVLGMTVIDLVSILHFLGRFVVFSDGLLYAQKPLRHQPVNQSQVFVNRIDYICVI